MNLENCKNKLISLEDKYLKDKIKVKEYYNEIMDAIYNYVDDKDEVISLKPIDEIVSGEDCEGILMNPNFNSLYYFKEYNEVYEVDYDLLVTLSRQTIKQIQKTKEKEFDLC